MSDDKTSLTPTVEYYPIFGGNIEDRDKDNNAPAKCFHCGAIGHRGNREYWDTCPVKWLVNNPPKPNMWVWRCPNCY